MTSSPDSLWTRLEAELRRRMPPEVGEIWLPLVAFGGVEGDRIVLHVPAEVHGWVLQRCGQVLQAAAAAVLPGGGVVLRAPGTPGEPAPVPAVVGAAEQPAPLNPKFSFEQYVIGDANRFAHAAALAVAEHPAQAYNPVFIVGPPGVGKTHLLHAIGSYVRQYGGGLGVHYTTVERFTNDFLAAIQARDFDAFKLRYRRPDVLLIDDVQFLAGKAKTEEEFFHTFNSLQEAGSQLVLTADRLPREIARLEERLRARFEAGLLVEIGAPDRATRLTVLRKRVEHDGIELADHDVLDLIADRVTTNVRALEGALIRVVAYASLTCAPLTCALVEKVLADLYDATAPPERVPGGTRHGTGMRFARRTPTIEHVQQLVAEAFGLTREELLSASRRAAVSWPRQMAMYVAREHTGESLPSIGRRFGGRDHTTVLHACRRVARRVAEDPEALAVLEAVTRRLGVDDDDRGG